MPEAECTGSIRIVKVPAGEAPIVIRAAWLGLTLPCSPYMGYVTDNSGVVTGKSSAGSRYGFVVPQDQAIILLEFVAPKAAEWWKQHGYPQPGKYFCFGADEAEIVSGVTREKLAVYDNMETGHWRRVL